MSTQDKIVKLFSGFGERTSRDLKNGAIEALRKAGRRNPSSIALEFDFNIKTTPDGDVELEIIAVSRRGKSAKYWRAIDEGRGKGKKPPPMSVVGKEWQNSNAIDPRVVLLNIKAKALSKRRGLTFENRKFKFAKKTLDFTKAAKTLSIIIAKSISKHGIKPKPYINSVLSEQRIEAFKKVLTPLLGEQFKLVIKGLE